MNLRSSTRRPSLGSGHRLLTHAPGTVSVGLSCAALTDTSLTLHWRSTQNGGPCPQPHRCALSLPFISLHLLWSWSPCLVTFAAEPATICEPQFPLKPWLAQSWTATRAALLPGAQRRNPPGSVRTVTPPPRTSVWEHRKASSREQFRAPPGELLVHHRPVLQRLLPHCSATRKGRVIQ